jgi:hypothetical protein
MVERGPATGALGLTHRQRGSEFRRSGKRGSMNQERLGQLLRAYQEAMLVHPEDRTPFENILNMLQGLSAGTITLGQVRRILGYQAVRQDADTAHQALYRQAAVALLQMEHEEYAPPVAPASKVCLHSTVTRKRRERGASRARPCSAPHQQETKNGYCFRSASILHETSTDSPQKYPGSWGILAAGADVLPSTPSVDTPAVLLASRLRMEVADAEGYADPIW